MSNRFSFAKLSIQNRLILFTCILLLCVILIFGYTSYLAVQNTALAAGKERLASLTEQISSMFQGFENVMTQQARKTSENRAMESFLKSNGTDSVVEAQEALNESAGSDVLIPTVELYDLNGVRLLSSDKKIAGFPPGQDFLADNKTKSAFQGVGKLYVVDTMIYFPIIVSVLEYGRPIGYLVRWRRLVTSRQELEGFSKLIGEQGRLYIGNDDNTLWTDGLKVIPSPPVSVGNIQKTITYTGPERSEVIASGQFVPGTHWIILVALSKQIVIQTANQFLYAITVIGAALLCLAVILAWLLSRYITTPLKKLTYATNNIASGNYDLKIEVNRKDEFGVLAQAFNSMAAEVYFTHQRLEKKVRERTEALQLANQELETFSYSVSHDLRSPVRKINNYVEIIKRSVANSLTEETQRMLNSIEKNTIRMEQLIEDILNFSQVNKEKISIEKINMTTLVRSIIQEQFSSLTKSETISVANLHSTFADSSLIQQVWINLIGNAIKFSRKTSNPCIEINSYKNDEEVVYFIKDNGIGFENAYAQRLFDAFQRLHAQSEFEGTGIGLATVKRIIERHKGRVWAESEPGKGATFYFSLPKKISLKN